MPYSTAAGDIWSLGIILTNMICGRQPWQRATSIDETFYRFLTEKESLLEELAISHDAAVLLTKIFTFGSANRISLADLRKEILEIKTFFLTPEEKAAAKPAVREVLESYSPRIPAAEPAAEVEDKATPTPEVLPKVHEEAEG